MKQSSAFVIPGWREAPGFDVQLHIRESIATVVVMDFRTRSFHSRSGMTAAEVLRGACRRARVRATHDSEVARMSASDIRGRCPPIPHIASLMRATRGVIRPSW
jgi:hypothetical protein